ncbi:NAD(P)H-binding protein [Actinocrispum sp. NPDC049592]|uniref:NAD(P)H-binding protein n=1 Tax=Actinocrispum sp. NPDC049592 TaxID=3154835 RepID=UPI00342D1AF6
MILVTGATGTIGRALIDLLVDAGAPVRAATRRTVDLPVDTVYADLGSPESLVSALNGVQQVFLLSSGADIPTHDANLARAAVEAGVGTIVKLSSGRAGDPAATDPIPNWHRAGEQSVEDSGLAWTFLRPMGFMSNTLAWAGPIRRDRTVYAAFAGGRVATIAPEDIAAVAARVLTEPGHAGQAYTLTGPEALTPAEMTAILAEVLELPLKFVEVSAEVARQAILDHGVPPVMADAIMALRATALSEFTATISPDVEKLTGTPATTFREWASRNRAKFR